MLYPSFIIDPVTAATTPTLLPSGQLALVPLDLTTVLMTQLITLQVSLTEDFGMRGWLSRVPGGQSLIAPLPDVFALSRTTPRPLTVYVAGQIPPSDNMLAHVSPGLYYLNILNLTNSAAMFSFVKTDLA